MSNRIAWMNGRFLPESEAHVSIFDRGLLFGDGVYDVATVLNGQLLDADFHLARLERSCAAIALANPHSAEEWTVMMHELLRQTGVTEGLVYLQVTRGVAERDFAFPKTPLRRLLRTRAPKRYCTIQTPTAYTW